MRLLDGLDNVVIEAEPLVVDPHKGHVVPVVGPRAGVDDDSEELVRAVGVDRLLADVCQLELEREGNAIRQLREALEVLNVPESGRADYEKDGSKGGTRAEQAGSG